MSLPSGPLFTYLGIDFEFPSCDVISNPVAMVTWKRIYHQLPTRVIQKQNVLRINDIQVSDEGLYTCTAKNYLGLYKPNSTCNHGHRFGEIWRLFDATSKV